MGTVPLSSDISNIIMLFKENNCRKYFIASLSLLINNVLCKSSNRQMTVVIDAGDDYCFFVPNITTGQNFDFDFEVTESSGAEGVNDISVRIQSPQPENNRVQRGEGERGITLGGGAHGRRLSDMSGQQNVNIRREDCLIRADDQ